MNLVGLIMAPIIVQTATPDFLWVSVGISLLGIIGIVWAYRRSDRTEKGELEQVSSQKIEEMEPVR